MSAFSKLRQNAGLKVSEALELLQLSVDSAPDYEQGARLLAPRQIQILKGLALGQTQKATTRAANGSLPIRSSATEQRMRDKPKKKSAQKLTSLELCAGAGGQAIGLESAGYVHEAVVEIDHDCCNTLRDNRPDWNVVEGDLRKFKGSAFKGIDLLAAGLPCPPFSIAGKQLGEKDERNLFPAALRLIDESRPRAVMIENVRGFLETSFLDYREKLRDQLYKMGYLAAWRILNAPDFGVPQLRPRVIIVALKRDIWDRFDWPQVLPRNPITVGEALYPLMASRGWAGAEACVARQS